MSFRHPEPPPTSGRHLTRLLSRWADTRRLGVRQADAIRQTIVALPQDLGFDWWWRLLDPDNGSVFHATATPSAFVGAASPPVVPAPFAMGVPELTAWTQDDAEYQPYLRLT